MRKQSNRLIKETEGEVLDAISIEGSTLVGVSTKKYPTKYGNCFSLRTEESKSYKILNFIMENLEFALDKKIINWPIKIKVLGEAHAVIHDSRIPHNWYKETFCEICTPIELLPLPQKLKRERQIEIGSLKVTEDGYKFFSLGKEVEWKVTN